MMKYFKLPTIFLFSAALALYTCKDKGNVQIQENPNPSTTEIATPPPTSKTTTPESSQNKSAVFHYTCSNGCAGGAASAVNCATCGRLLVHNQAFHSNTNSNNNKSLPIPFTSPPATNAGQNTAGVWHYTCSNGCAGGSGTTGNCASCGAALAHNQAYHQ
jgi:hypothetical protein